MERRFSGAIVAQRHARQMQVSGALAVNGLYALKSQF
jgi:hypothetical protein